MAAEWEFVTDELVGLMSTPAADLRGRVLPKLRSLREMVIEAPTGDLQRDSLRSVERLILWVDDEGRPE